MTEIRSLKYKIVPGLVVLLTIILPFLHHTISRKYNYQIAIVELLIIFAAILVYKRDFFISLPTDSFEFKLIILFLISGLISTLISPKIGIAIHRYISIIIWLIYLWLMVYLIQEKYLSPRILVITGAASCLLPIAIFLISYGVSDTDQSLMATFDRLNFYSNIRHFGYHLTAATLASLYFLIDQSFNLKKLAFGVFLIAINFSTLIVSGSRQGILVVTIFSSLLFVFYYRKYWLPILVTLLICLIMLVAAIYSDSGENTLHLLHRLSLSGLTSGAWGRTDLWITTFGMIKESAAFGYGAEAFVALRKSLEAFAVLRNGIELKSAVHPHSIIFQSLLEWGFIGSVLYFSILISALSKFRKRIDFKNLSATDTPVITAFLSICALLTNSLIDGTYYHVLPIYFSSISFAILIASKHTTEDDLNIKL